MNTVDLCFLPEEKKYDGGISVLIDIFRFTSVLTYALFNGAKSVIPIESIENAKKIKKDFPGYVLAGERNTEKMKGFDLGNSPLEFSKDFVKGRNIISTTTNGTRAVNLILNSEEIIAGAFLNSQKVINYLKTKKKDIYLICSGTNGKVSLEDVLYAGLIASNLNKYFTLTDSAIIGKEIYNLHKKDLISFMLKNSCHAKVLLSKKRFDDINFCGKIDIIDILPIWCFKDKAFRREGK